MNRKTATVTWISWNNYGSYLQAYALQQVVHALGYDNVIISDERIVYPNGRDDNVLWQKDQSFLRSFYYFVHRLFNKFKLRQRELSSIERSFSRFRKKHLKVEESFSNTSDLNERYDLFIAGSDQIWAPSNTLFKPFYYLAFTSKKKISYAASLNAAFIPENLKAPISELLADFDHVSVREETGRLLLKSIVNKDIEVCLDPTLLLSAEEWDCVADHHRVSRRPYLLCYFLTYNEDYLHFAREYADRLAVPLIIFAMDERYRPFADKMLATGPSGFIKAIKDAKAVLTDSFHGTVFSIIYEKDFITFRRFKGKDEHNQDERLWYLFDITGIEGRFWDETGLTYSSLPSIDYCSVKEKLLSKQNLSISYLRDALDA